MAYDLNMLADYFPSDAVEWRLQNAKPGMSRGLAVPYVTNRAIQDRLDQVVGPLNWRNEFKTWHRFNTKDGEVIGQLCGIFIYDPDKGIWIDKWDGAEQSAVKPVKGGLSDAMKRAAVQWSIGRYLYKMDAIWVDIEPTKNAKVMRMTDKAAASLDGIYLRMLDRIKANEPIPTPNRQALGLDDSAPLWTPDPVGGQDSAGKPAAETPAPASAATPAPAAAAAPAPGPAPAPQGVYTVVDRAAQLVGNNAHVKLRRPDGNVVNAFLRGGHQEVQKGAQLVKVRMSQKTEGGYAYYTVSSFELAA